MPVLTKAETFEHGRLRVRFTCVCGRALVANFTRREFVRCRCGRRHYPIVNLVTRRRRKDRS